MKPKRGSAKGATTITVCALQRRGLRAARRDRLLDLIAHLESVVEAQNNVVRHPDDPDLRRLRDGTSAEAVGVVTCRQQPMTA